MCEEDRVDTCKCGKAISWDPYNDDYVTCPHCKTKYKVDCDSVLTYWLEEVLEQRNPYKTDPR